MILSVNTVLIQASQVINNCFSSKSQYSIMTLSTEASCRDLAPYTVYPADHNLPAVSAAPLVSNVPAEEKTK